MSSARAFYASARSAAQTVLWVQEPIKPITRGLPEFRHQTRKPCSTSAAAARRSASWQRLSDLKLATVPGR
jgi:hypothetical protein